MYNVGNNKKNENLVSKFLNLYYLLYNIIELFIINNINSAM